MRTKEEFMEELRRRERRELSESMQAGDYMRGVVRIVFEITAETLAEVKASQPQTVMTAGMTPNEIIEMCANLVETDGGYGRMFETKAELERHQERLKQIAAAVRELKAKFITDPLRSNQ